MRVSAEYIKQCFYFDDEAGKVKWKARPREHFQNERDMTKWNAKYPGVIAGTLNSKGYQIVYLANRVQIRCHYISWVLAHGKYPDLPQIDHRDGNRQNNHIGNLRECTVAQNNRNSWREPGVSGFKGVRVNKKLFRAQISVDGVNMDLGGYKTAEEAHQVYRAAAIKHFGEFANFDKRSNDQTTGEKK